MKFMAMCSSGLGSSFMVQMNIEKALRSIGVEGIDVDHTDLGSASPADADMFFVGRDLKNSVSNFQNVQILNSIIDQDELTERVKDACDQLGVPHTS
ncbi:PTS sugar transporter subunit IIB [Cutibacterium sp. WCA-380-WT-3A]|uniref:PTS sugar transporter subunit IIB n=1 Tax=Cutibacterium porci TaxID=2605781 RepID=A0A7K0J450_9ACTN|nr:PTS sugar transporter subunit IIB [Cutibacterium porci]